MLLLSSAILAMAVGVSAGAAPACKPAECLKRISAKAVVVSSKLTKSALLGNWSDGSGLSGSELYLFDDDTYIYTEWADVEPETIYDKGRWTLERRVYSRYRPTAT